MTHRAPRWTAAAIVVACLGWLLIAGRGGPAFALDELVDTILNARTARFEMTALVEGQQSQKMKAYFMEPSRFRQELEGGYINISDFDIGKMVGLDPATKQATVFNLVNKPPELKEQENANQFEVLRDRLRQAMANPDKMVKALGEKELDGHKVVGFRFQDGAMPMTIWADPQTKLPYRIESVMVGPPRTEVVMTNYEFNIDLNESLFSLDVPDGYEVMEMDVDVSKPSEKELITALRMCCEVSDGEFPKGLDTAAVAGYVVKYLQKLGVDKDKQPNADQMKQILRISRGLQFALVLPPESAAHYAGAGAKEGNDQRAVFWYKPSGSETYRVVYADFSVRKQATPPEVDGAVKLRDSRGEKPRDDGDE